MEDLHRRVIKAMQHHAPGIHAVLIREKRHVVLDFTYQGRTARSVISKSPKNLDFALRNACTCICRDLNLPKINH